MKHLRLLLAILMINNSVLAQAQKMKDILSAYEFETKTLTLDGIEISYIEEGEGKETLLFLHGLSSNADAWSKNIKTLKTNYRCIAIDLPGFGKSSLPAADYTPTFFAEVTYRFLKEKNIDQVVLVGHSMGGQASIRMAALHPEVVDKLILVAPAGIEKFTVSEGQMITNVYTPEVVKSTTDDQIKKNYALNFFKPPEGVSKMIQDRINIKTAVDFNAHCEAIVKSINGMLQDPVFEDLKAIRQKTLVIFGAEDMLIPNRYLHPTLSVNQVGRLAIEEIRNAELRSVKESGHFVQYEKPDEVNAIIKRFLESTEK